MPDDRQVPPLCPPRLLSIEDRDGSSGVPGIATSRLWRHVTGKRSAPGASDRHPNGPRPRRGLGSPQATRARAATGGGRPSPSTQPDRGGCRRGQGGRFQQPGPSRPPRGRALWNTGAYRFWTAGRRRGISARPPWMERTHEPQGRERRRTPRTRARNRRTSRNALVLQLGGHRGRVHDGQPNADAPARLSIHPRSGATWVRTGPTAATTRRVAPTWPLLSPRSRRRAIYG